MRILKKSKPKLENEKLRYNFYVFDCETTKLEPQPKNFVFGVLYGYYGAKVFYSVEDFINEFNKPKYKNKYFFAHNAEFDLMTLFGNIFKTVDSSAVFNGKFIFANYKGRTFADSMNIYPSSVKKIGEVIGLEKYENPKISKERLRVHNISNEDIIYCKRDCEIIYKALLKIFEMTRGIKITLPGIALNDYRTNYLSKDIYFSDLVDEFFESYYGGRTEAFKIGSVNANVYDINSMYPYVMQYMKFPDLNRLKKETDISIKFFLYLVKHYEGLAEIEVVHNKTFIGYLPCKVKINGFEKLVFPIGRFKTTVNFNELRFAIDSNVIEIKKVFKVVYGKGIDSPFKEFVLDKYHKRKTTENELEKVIFKNMMNSLYGKFGQKEKFKTTYYEEIPFEKINKLEKLHKFYELKLFSGVRSDCYLVTKVNVNRGSYYSIPLFASYITSESRLTLLKALIDNEKNNLVYCDTDSIFIDCDSFGNFNFNGNISDTLGSFKLEDKKIIEIRGLKNYTYIDKNGEKQNAIKGISKLSREAVDPKTGSKKYIVPKYVKTKQAIRQNIEPGKSFEMEKTLKQKYDKRIVFENGMTEPLSLPLPVHLKIRKKPRTPDRIKAILNNDPENIYQAIMHYFISGGRIRTKDLKRHIQGKGTELKAKTFIYASKEGKHLDTLYEYFSFTFGAENFEGFEFCDMVLDIINSFNTKWGMIEFLEKTKSK